MLTSIPEAIKFYFVCTYFILRGTCIKCLVNEEIFYFIQNNQPLQNFCVYAKYNEVQILTDNHCGFFSFDILSAVERMGVLNSPSKYFRWHSGFPLGRERKGHRQLFWSGSFSSRDKNRRSRDVCYPEKLKFKFIRGL